MKTKQSQKPTAAQVLTHIATLLEQPANRFGKIEFFSVEAMAAREAIRELAVRYGVQGASTVLEQAAQVARAVLKS